MAQKKSLSIISIVLNFIVFGLTVIWTILIVAGVKFNKNAGVEILFLASNVENLKYFTVDSNVLAGIAAIIYAILQIKRLKGSVQTMPKWVYALKLAGTAGITLTMFVTMFFLAPQYKDDWFSLFRGVNFFFHLVSPMLCIITFLALEPAEEHPFKYTLFGVLPMVAYSFFYTTNVMVHLENGIPLKKYDWYDFLGGNLSNAFITIPVMLLVTWGITILLWWVNKIISKRCYKIFSANEL